MDTKELIDIGYLRYREVLVDGKMYNALKRLLLSDHSEILEEHATKCCIEELQYPLRIFHRIHSWNRFLIVTARHIYR